VLSSRHFTRLMRLLREHFSIAPDAEVTLEANPESVRPSLLDTWLACGVNRLSMGAQSFEPAQLRVLGRIHDEHRPADAVALARAHGFERVSVDLMFAYPGHTPEAFARSLARALELGVEHLSCYCYITEAGTPLGDAVLAGHAVLPDDDAQAALYAALEATCARAGFAPYETSNFCRPLAEARHNLTYWLRRDYLALGPSAHGLWQGVRYANHFALAEWAGALERGQACEADHEIVTPAQLADEIVLLGLRLASGLWPGDHPASVQALLEQRYGTAFREGAAAGRLERTSQGWRLPAAHRFVADDTIAWLAARALPVDTGFRASLESSPGVPWGTPP
jgi:oxygen-independent coproporphyrinogen-3 oxidase